MAAGTSVFAFVQNGCSGGWEGVGVDAQGNVYGAVVRRQMLEKVNFG